MHWETLSIPQLSSWVQLNNVELHGVAFADGHYGSGVFAARNFLGEEQVLMTIPQELVLSLENVWVCAKSDRHLLQILESLGNFSRTARGAILIFLLLQLTHNMTNGAVGMANPFCQYLRFLPRQIPLPTFWNEDERALIVGTSLEVALKTKLKSLEREFDLVRENTAGIEWCKKYWWSAESELTIEDWKYVDAAYRSRALDLPGTGHSTVPCIDMANHASGTETSAVYETDSNGNAILVLYAGKTVKIGDEVTITYGDEKGACEMIFSYGFLEEDRTFAKELFLDLDIADDDPLRMAKKAASKSPPGFRLFAKGELVGWESDFVWLLCINEEDGLEFQLMETSEGERQICTFWKEQEVSDPAKFQQLLEKDEMWDVFQLRAITTLQARVETQLMRLSAAEEDVRKMQEHGDIRAEPEGLAMELRDLEESLLLAAYQSFEDSKNRVIDSEAVQAYLRRVTLGPREPSASR